MSRCSTPWLLAAATALATLASPSVLAQAATGQTIAEGLERPWAVAFLPGGRFLVTEKPGRLRVIEPDGRIGAPVVGVPRVVDAGQGGLLDVITDSGFASNRTIYFCFSEAGGNGGNSTALARARLSPDNRSLQDVQVIFSQKPKVRSSLHFGCRIVERTVNGQPDGTLFLTLGDRYSQRHDAQRLGNHHGKVVRVGKDGSVPRDNPFVGRRDALPEIWSYGHRNPQGATLAPDGRYWIHEHAAQGGDEINLPLPGKNYGWPETSKGVDYGGAPIGTGKPSLPGVEEPLHFWIPSIAPSGMAFVTSDRYPGWKGNLMVGALKFQYLARLELKNGKVVAEHKLLDKVGHRMRDVKQGPDGWLYVVTDNRDGKLIRVRQ